MRGAEHRDIVELEGTRFDPGSGDLEGPSGDRARLAPQPARLLELLVEHRGSVVTRDTMAAYLWPEGSVEADAGIGFAIREIRKGLEAVGGSPELIETLPRRGYRLRSPATTPSHGGGPAPVAARIPLLPALAGLLGVAALLAWALRPAPPPVLAVFPYAAAGDDRGVRPEGRELASLVTAHLTRTLDGRVGIVGPTGVSDLDGPNDTEGAAARGVCLVLSGSMRMAADTGTVVFSQIVRTSDRVHLWARWDTIPPGDSRAVLMDAVTAGAAEAARGCR